jgi:hypothetical protein
MHIVALDPEQVKEALSQPGNLVSLVSDHYETQQYGFSVWPSIRDHHWTIYDPTTGTMGTVRMTDEEEQRFRGVHVLKTRVQD